MVRIGNFGTHSPLLILRTLVKQRKLPVMYKYVNCVFICVTTFDVSICV